MGSGWAYCCGLRFFSQSYDYDSADYVRSDAVDCLVVHGRLGSVAAYAVVEGGALELPALCCVLRMMGATLSDGLVAACQGRHARVARSTDDVFGNARACKDV